MTDKMPIKLSKTPLVEAVWEVRFVAEQQSAFEALPGVLYQALASSYPSFVRLPAADLPAFVMEQDPNLRYAPRVRLEGNNQAVQVGAHVIALSARRPYPGWQRFSRDIRDLIQIINDSRLVKRAERFSLKYVNLLALDSEPTIERLNLRLQLAGYEICAQPIQIRTEIIEREIKHIVQIASPVVVSFPDPPETMKGVLLDIDAIMFMKESEPLSSIAQHLDKVHASLKEVFFIKMLTKETLAELEPEYEEEQT